MASKAPTRRNRITRKRRPRALRVAVPAHYTYCVTHEGFTISGPGVRAKVYLWDRMVVTAICAMLTKAHTAGARRG